VASLGADRAGLRLNLGQQRQRVRWLALGEGHDQVGHAEPTLRGEAAEVGHAQQEHAVDAVLAPPEFVVVVLAEQREHRHLLGGQPEERLAGRGTRGEQLGEERLAEAARRVERRGDARRQPVLDDELAPGRLPALQLGPIDARDRLVRGGGLLVFPSAGRSLASASR
jgi:hypothetical protein